MKTVGADSTVGMTLYNCLCMVGKQTLTADQLFAMAVRAQHADLDSKQFKRALDKLVDLKRVKVEEIDGATVYSHRAGESLFVCQRDLGDIDPFDMTVGGWEGWQVKDPRIRDGKGVRPIEELLGLPPTGRSPRPLNREQPMVSKNKNRPGNAATIKADKLKAMSARIQASNKHAEARNAQLNLGNKAAAEHDKVQAEADAKSEGARLEKRNAVVKRDAEIRQAAKVEEVSS